MQPKRLAIFGYPKKAAFEKLSLIQPLPEALIVGAVGVLIRAEHAVMLVANVLKAVAGGCQKIVVGGNNAPLKIKLDGGHGAINGVDDTLMGLFCLHGFGDIPCQLHNLGDLATRIDILDRNIAGREP